MNVRAEITEATPLPLPHDAAFADAYRNIEGALYDTKNMARLIEMLFDDMFSGRPEDGRYTFNVSEADFDAIFFGISHLAGQTEKVLTLWKEGYAAAREGGAA